MTEAQKEEVRQTARRLCRDRRISLETAIWAMKNAGYTRKETVEWLEISDQDIVQDLIGGKKSVILGPVRNLF
jgi:hypothetical protein